MTNYQLAFDEIHALTSIIYKTSDDIEDDLLSILINAYSLGIDDICEEVGYWTEVNIQKMKDSIYKSIEGKTFLDRAREHMIEDGIEDLIMLMESEFHRVYNEAEMDGANQIQKENSVSVYKKWNTKKDPKVRETHSYLEGEFVPLDEEFFTFDNDHALCPGGFEKASNNVNCRCKLNYEIR